MEKEFITYKEALALKELGFNEECLAGFKLEDNTFYMDYNTDDSFTLSKSLYLSTPLYQQAFRWFRDEYDLTHDITKYGDRDTIGYTAGTYKGQSCNWEKDDYKSYEEAEFACLRKLIEIVNR